MRNLIRQFNKYLLNPLMLTVAGRRFWYAAVIHHTGRRTGKAHQTPVVARPVGDGFIIPLPYGTQVDWLQNVLAAGKATLRAHGEQYDVVDPEVLDASVALPLLPTAVASTWRLFRIAQYLRVRTGIEEPVTGPTADQEVHQAHEVEPEVPAAST